MIQSQELRSRIAELEAQVEKAPDDLDILMELESLVDELEFIDDEARLHEARQDPNAFVEYCFNDKTGRPLRQGRLHRQWQQLVRHPEWNPRGHARALIIAPRDHGKTTQIPVARAIWELGRNPNLRIKIACQSDSKAMERLFEITDHLERNERVQKVFPHLKPAQRGDWTKHKIVVNRTMFSKDASIEALGILSTATGGRADLLIADDIVDRRNAIQFPQIRETIKHAWKSDWTNLLEPDGRVIYICTLWHTADLSHELIDNAAYAVLRHDVSSNKTRLEGELKLPRTKKKKRWKEPLWEHWTKDALQEREDEIGKVEFDRAFRNIALSGEIVVVLPEVIRYFDPAKLPENLIMFQAFDLAISKKAHADYFAEVTAGGDPETGLVYILDAWHAKLSFMQQAWAVVRGYLTHGPEIIVMEIVSYQDSLPQFLDAIVGKPLRDLDKSAPPSVKIPSLPIEKRIRAPGIDKMTRLKFVTPQLDRSRVLFHPKFNPESAMFLSERGDLIGELVEFPLSKNDDLLDAFVDVVRVAVRSLGEMRAADDDDDDDTLECRVHMIGEP